MTWDFLNKTYTNRSSQQTRGFIYKFNTELFFHWIDIILNFYFASFAHGMDINSWTKNNLTTFTVQYLRLEDLLEEVLESSVVSLHDSVLCTEVEWPSLVQSVLHTTFSKSSDWLSKNNKKSLYTIMTSWRSSRQLYSDLTSWNIGEQ